MQVNRIKLYNLLDGSNSKVVIPIYQRPYSWKKEQCKRLIEDLKDVYTRGYQTHFLGTIVYVVRNDGKWNENFIVDGQQRIITFSLLLLAIIHLVQKNPSYRIGNIHDEQILNSYLIHPYEDDVKRLSLIVEDDRAYDALLKGKELVQDSAITSNYLSIYDMLAAMEPHEVGLLYDAAQKLDIVSISLEPPGDDPQLIFESLNSTGLQLTESDKIRNYVLMDEKTEKQSKLFLDYWKPIEEWVGRDRMDVFIHFYLALKTKTVSVSSRLYGDFKLYCRNTGMSKESLIEDMWKYAKCYHDVMVPKEKTGYGKVLLRLNKLKIEWCIPLYMHLLQATQEGLLSEEKLQSALLLIESYLVRRAICGLASKHYKTSNIQLISDLDHRWQMTHTDYYELFCRLMIERTNEKRFPNDHEVRRQFGTYNLFQSDAAMRKLILERLENFGNREQINVNDLLAEKVLSIEHIMPQKLTEKWKEELGSEWERIHSQYKDTIGNLTLSAYNSDYSNSLFMTKRDMKGKGFTESKLYLNQYVASCARWGEEQIRERAQILSERALQIWMSPEFIHQKTDCENWIYWDEHFDFTHKNVIRIRVQGNEFETKNTGDMFKKINKYFYEVNPRTYLSKQFSWVSQFSDSLRRPYKLAEDAYIEVNKSNKDKLKCIKLLAKAYQLSSVEISFLLKSESREREKKS